MCEVIQDNSNFIVTKLNKFGSYFSGEHSIDKNLYDPGVAIWPNKSLPSLM